LKSILAVLGVTVSMRRLSMVPSIDKKSRIFAYLEKETAGGERRS
jgi:hypothetical protein